MQDVEAGANHAQLMDGVYRHQRLIYDLTRKYYLLGRDRLIEELDVPDGGSVLEIGCGTGRNLVLTARRYPHARCFGIDLSSQMLKSAGASVEKARLRGRIRLGRADAAAFDPQAIFGAGKFDRVFISYSLSMIPPWREALAQAITVTAPGGCLHVVDFGGQQQLPHWFGVMLRRWLAKFHVSPRENLQQEMASAAEHAGGTLAFRSLYRDYARVGVIRLPAATV